MSEVTLVKTRIQAGVWEGMLRTSEPMDEPPGLVVTHLEHILTTLSVTPDAEDPQRWNVKVAIPPDLLSEGVQTFLIRDIETEETLQSFSVVTGTPLEDDIRGEMDLLRAELDMLKRAFRRHCTETL